MKRTERERKAGAKDFANFWKGKGYEKGHAQQFWTSLLTDVFGVSDPKRTIAFESKVKLDHTSFIDGYIESTHVLIEQKSINKDLSAPIRQSDGSELTPYEQAKRYANELAYSDRPRWIVVSNFKEFHIYDMEHPQQEAHVIPLEELPARYHELDFLVDADREEIIQEQEISVKAGELVGRLYDLLLAQYADQKSPETFRSLNRLCVRIVFCLYAEDSGLFSSHLQFHDYLKQFNPGKMRKGLIELFEALNTSPEDRDPYMDDDLAAFPYVSGGLFEGSNDNIIPQFTKEIADLLLDKASAGFDWSEISPTIFGAVFESTLNPVTRHDGGMHYTSVENIHKVTEPLFMDALYKEFESIKTGNVVSEKTRKNKLLSFQDKLASIKVLDPACGSGNFLTQTYIDFRRLENKVVQELTGGQAILGMDEFNPIKVGIGQFYGIEINDFAVTVAMTALWIAEAQMLKATEDIIKRDIEFFPLKSYANIHEGNALTLDWNEVVQKNELDYIIGNPPFLGYPLQSEEQRKDIKDVYCSIYSGQFNQKVDYVSGWFYKSADFINGTTIQCGFVASNSICQGEQPPLIWKPIVEQKNINILFAYTPFVWDSEATDLAHVHCVIIGFDSKENNDRLDKTLFIDGGRKKSCKNINAYLLDGPSVFIESRTRPINDVPLITKGNQPTDGGNLIIEEKDYRDFLKKEPSAKPYVKLFLGAHEFLHDQKRYCLWFSGINTELLMDMPLVSQRLKNVREMRAKSTKKVTRDDARTPWLFQEIRQPKSGNFLMIPRHSSENRKYMPMGFLSSDVIASDAALIIPDISLFHFGILQSSVHMAWMRAFCGRIKSDYRYSANIVYNNFPWPDVSEEDKKQIEKTGKGILIARENHKTLSLAKMYGEGMILLSDLVEAHDANDKAVMKAYGLEDSLSEDQIVGKLMEKYQVQLKASEFREDVQKAIRKIWGLKNEAPMPEWLMNLRKQCIAGELSIEDLLKKGKEQMKAEKAAAKKENKVEG